MEQQVAVGICRTSGAVTAKSRLGPGPSARSPSLMLPLSEPLNAITFVVSSGSPQVPTAVTLPSDSTTAMLSQLVMYCVCSGWRRGSVPNQVFFFTANCIVSPMRNAVCGAETWSCEIHKRNHKTPVAMTRAAPKKRTRRIDVKCSHAQPNNCCKISYRLLIQFANKTGEVAQSPGFGTSRIGSG